MSGNHDLHRDLQYDLHPTTSNAYDDNYAYSGPSSSKFSPDPSTSKTWHERQRSRFSSKTMDTGDHASGSKVGRADYSRSPTVRFGKTTTAGQPPRSRFTRIKSRTGPILRGRAGGARGAGGSGGAGGVGGTTHWDTTDSDLTDSDEVRGITERSQNINELLCVQISIHKKKQ